MPTETFSSLAINPGTGCVMYSPALDQPAITLRVCLDQGTPKLILGTPDDPIAYDALALLRGLLLGGSELGTPLPNPVALPKALLELSHADSEVLVCAAQGMPRPQLALMAATASHADTGLDTTVIPERGDALAYLMARAESMGFAVKNANTIRAIEDKARAQLMQERAAQSTQDRLDMAIADATSSTPTAVTHAEYFQVVPGGEALLSRLERQRATKTSITAARVTWPFSTMSVGDAVTIPPALARRAQTAVHVYAARSHKRFSTQKDRLTGSVQVVRLNDPTATGNLD